MGWLVDSIGGKSLLIRGHFPSASIMWLMPTQWTIVCKCLLPFRFPVLGAREWGFITWCHSLMVNMNLAHSWINIHQGTREINLYIILKIAEEFMTYCPQSMSGRVIAVVMVVLLCFQVLLYCVSFSPGLRDISPEWLVQSLRKEYTMWPNASDLFWCL